MRRKVKNRNIVQPDFVYNSQKLEKFINYVMLRGQKETARGIVYGALDIVKEKAKVEDLILLLLPFYFCLLPYLSSRLMVRFVASRTARTAASASELEI